jgi:DnaJ-class molecular chaperone
MTEQDPTLRPGDQAKPGTSNTGENLCPDCSGSGKLEGQTCQTCQGTGRVTEGIGGA